MDVEFAIFSAPRCLFLHGICPSARLSLALWKVDDPLLRHALCSALGSGQRDGLCPRCKEASEDLIYRLWYCRANEQYRLQLDSLVPAAVSFPDSLPHTLARTGILPAGWDVLSLEEFKCLLNCSWCCAADGTRTLAGQSRGLPEAPSFAF